jgi:cytoskeleton protein RodZ
MSFEDYKSLVAETESVGAALMCARIASNLSIEDLAERTKVGTRFLRALEQDDYAVFVSRIYIFGFAKAYAKVVGLDIEGVVASLRRQLSPQ